MLVGAGAALMPVAAIKQVRRVENCIVAVSCVEGLMMFKREVVLLR